MTPTEQDKGLGEELYGLLRTDPRADTYAIPYRVMDIFVEFITADRKRVALEARLDEIGLMQHQARVNLKTSNAVAEWGDIRIAQLKAQQEKR